MTKPIPITVEALSPEIKNKLISRTCYNPETSCWEWTGAVSAKGWHGQIRIGKNRFQTHRVAWSIWNGEIPEDTMVCHKCDNPICINPEHLFLGTALDNIADNRAKGRMLGSNPTDGRVRVNAPMVISVFRLYKSGLKKRHIAKELNICEANVHHILKRDTWKHVAVPEELL